MPQGIGLTAFLEETFQLLDRSARASAAPEGGAQSVLKSRSLPERHGTDIKGEMKSRARNCFQEASGYASRPQGL